MLRARTAPRTLHTSAAKPQRFVLRNCLGSRSDREVPVVPVDYVTLADNAGVWIPGLQAIQYDLYGPSFIIHRSSIPTQPNCSNKEQLNLIYRPSFPMLSSGLPQSSYPLVYIQREQSCVGIIPSDTEPKCESNEEEQFDSSVFETPNSGFSPRRTAKLKFKCNLCGAVNIKPVNPTAFKECTVFAQCASCNVTHKIVDNLKLFHEFKGPVFGSPSGLDLDESLLEGFPLPNPLMWDGADPNLN